MLQSVPHQIVQSPARLGLSSPTSPSLQNPTAYKLSSQISQSNQPNQQSNLSTTTTTTTTSSNLLSLLPPLSRAQSLLLQMASLASKLFEVSPNRSAWLNSYRGSLPTFLSSQTLTSPPLDSSPSSTKEILSLFTSLQTQMFEAVAELQEIDDLQKAKEEIKREIRFKDTAILAFANKLKEAEEVLDILVDDYSDYRRPKRSKSEHDMEDDSSCTTTVASQLKLTDILPYAHRISYTTYAPPEFGSGLAPLRGALPPAPQEEQMRASQLYNFANLDVGLPKDERKDKEIEAFTETPEDTNPLPKLSAIQGLDLSSITVPSGWKPGMPVDLSLVLPPGLLPGDPVSFPSSRVDEPLPPPRPIPAPGLPKAPESIQVRPVQLDITMDEDDDSSDYDSSGDESSEDED